MRKIKFMAIVAIICLLSLFAFASCFDADDNSTGNSAGSETVSETTSETTGETDNETGSSGEEETLAAPEITLADDFSVVWAAVEGATGYKVNVNGEDLNVTTALSFAAFKVAGGYAIKVKAVKNETESEYSDAVDYSVYSVSIATGEGFELTGEKIVYGGKNYEFTLEIKGAAYQESTPAVKVNGAEIAKNADEKYVVENVAENLVITVEGIVKTEFSVTKPDGEGFEFKGAEKAVYGENYVFEVTKSVGYDKSDLTVKVNGETVTAGEDDKYTVENVTENLVITVEGAAKNVYSVTLPESVAYVITGETTVTHGEDYTFVLEIAEKYDKTNLVVKANETELNAGEDGKTYIVTNVTENVTITVEGLNIIKYAVTLTEGTGYVLTGEAEAEHGGKYSFELTVSEGYTQSTPVVKVNGEVVTAGEDGKYTVENVTANLVVTVEGVVINTYTVTVAAGEGFTAEKTSETVNHGENASFAIVPVNAEDVIKVFNGEEEVAYEDGAHVVKNVTADAELTVKVYDLASQMFLAINLPMTENDGYVSITCRTIRIDAAWVEKLIKAGYTHIKYDLKLTGGVDIALTHNGTWDKFWRILDATDTARIDLAEFTADGNYYGWSMEVRDSSANQTEGTVELYKPVLIKSEETAKWTKSNTSVYCAEEDGYIVLDTRCSGNDAHVVSSAEWWKRYAGNPIAGEVSQRTVVLTGKYLKAGSNSRGAVFGGAGAGVGVIGGTANTEFYTEYMNNLVYAEGNQFYLGLDKEGVYQGRVGDFVSSRNAWGGFSVDFNGENSLKLTMPDGGKFLYVFTQDMIAAGYTKIRVTAGEYTSGQVWIGNDNWSGGMFGLNSGATQVLELSIFTESYPYFQIFASGDLSNVTITYEFVK